MYNKAAEEIINIIDEKFITDLTFQLLCQLHKRRKLQEVLEVFDSAE